jgi:predicted lipoprotein with Yx(FWY)xxD motif
MVALLMAALAAGVLATAAWAATSFTLKEAKHAKVVNFNTHKVSHPNVVVNSKGFVAYTLSGDSKKHPLCFKSNMCLHFWPPVTVKSIKSLSKAPGVKGKLSTWKRLGFIQVLINGHPLYTFLMDTHKDVATGEALVAFGGTWHVQLASPKAASGPGGGGPGGY